MLAGIITSLSGVISVVGSGVEAAAGLVSDLTSGVLGMLVFVSPVIDPYVLLTCLSVILVLLVGSLLFRIGNWLFNKIPEIAGFGWGG